MPNIPKEIIELDRSMLLALIEVLNDEAKEAKANGSGRGKRGR